MNPLILIRVIEFKIRDGIYVEAHRLINIKLTIPGAFAHPSLETHFMPFRTV